MRKFILLFTFFLAFPITLLASVLLMLFSAYRNDPSHIASFFRGSHSVAYAALPSSQNVFSEEIEQADGRVERIRQFLEKYKSPLEPHAEEIVMKARQYNLDDRLLVSIAMQESNLCKKIPENSYNCWGFGIYGKTVTRFDDYSHAIEIVSKALGTRYKGKHGLVTPEEIMTMYTPSSNGSWARGVNHFMDELE